MSRRDARDIAFKLIFAYTFDNEKNVEAFEEYVAEVDSDDKAYVSEVYNGVVSHYDELMEDVKNNAEKYDVSRIYKIDLAIILLALYEIKFMSDIPFKVSVDEAVNLARKYSTEKSGKYINGILSKFAR
jgi:N utilization substance protein B